MATRSVTAQPRSDRKDHAEIDAIFPRSTHLLWSKRKGQAGRPWSANTVTRSCVLSLSFFAQPVAFFELLWQSFSFFVSLQLGMAIPVRAVSPCDGGHGAAAGFARLLFPSAVGHLGFFGARPEGMPESSSLSWPECGRTSALQSVQFWPLGDNSSTASKRWLGGKSLSGKRQRTSYAIIRPPQSSVTEDKRSTGTFSGRGRKEGIARSKAVSP